MAEQNEFLEPEEMASAFNPLDAPVNEKSYTRPNVSFDPSEINTPIPEPVFTPPPIEKKTEEKRERKPIEPFNEQLNDLPNKEKSASSEQMATMIIEGYALICNLVEKSLVISDKKVRKLEMDGDVDMNLTVQFPNNIQLTFKEFVDEFNKQAEGTLAVTDDFKNEVRPVLIRILQKKGIGLTDEQFLIFIFAKDVITKGFQFAALKSQINEMIEMMKNQTLEYRRYNSGSVPPPPPPPPPTPSPEPTYTPPATNYQRQEPEFVPTEVVENFDFEDEEDDMPDWAKPAPSANDIVNEMTNPEGLGVVKRKKSTKRLK